MQDLKLAAESLREQVKDLELDGCVIVLIKKGEVGSVYASTAHVDNVIGVIIQFLASVRDQWIKANGEKQSSH